MSLATRCPHCSTLFRVQSSQLQTHDGQVRCGHCKAVFSGIDHLTASDTEVWKNLSLQQNTVQEGVTENAKSPVQSTGPEQGSENDPPLHPATDTKPSSKQTPANRTETSPTQKKTSNTETTFLNSGTQKPKRPTENLPAPTWAKATLAILLMLALAQGAWLSRQPIVASVATLSNWVNQAAPATQSMFAGPATRYIEVEGSGLQALDENRIRLDVTLTNRNRLPAQWPYLKVDLLDPQGLVLASKLVAPNHYIKRDTEQAVALAPPIPGGETVEVLAYLSIETLNQQLPESAATGFKLELFDAPPLLDNR